MKIFIMILLMVSSVGWAQQPLTSKHSKVNEYLNEERQDKDISLTKDEIRKKVVPSVYFSIEGKKRVDSNFFKDEFVTTLLSKSGVLIGDNGDLSFEIINPPKVDYEYSLKDEEDYSDEEISQFKAMVESYYQFRDYEYYEDYYYYYDKATLEKYKIDNREKENSYSFKKTYSYIISSVMEFFPQIILSLNPSPDSVIIYYSSSSASKYSASIKYDVASAAEANRSLLEEALSYYQNHKDQFSNHRFMAVLEFNKHSAKSRFYIINLNKMAVIGAYHVAHGKGSDPDNDGYATYFSNQPGSEASSLGVYKTGDIYSAKWGVALRLHGLSPTNSNVYRRGIVIHPSLYVKEANVKAGRSFGCMAFDYKVSGDVINMLRGGGFIYAKYIR